MKYVIVIVHVMLYSMVILVSNTYNLICFTMVRLNQ